MMRRVYAIGVGMLVVVALCAPAWATVDLNGTFVGATGQVLGFGPFPCAPINVTQTGTALSVSATCDILGSPATFTGSGTIDTNTGAFSVTGQGSFLCTTPGSFQLAGTGSGDSYNISGTVTCSFNLTFFATRCGNGTLDSGEDQSCDDAAASGVSTLNFPRCCTDHCALQPNGTQCGFSLNGNCDALDFCDGVSTACPDLHQPNGTPCDDFSPCTDNTTCNGGVCTGGNPAPEGTDCSLGFSDPCFDALCDSAGGCIISPTNNPCDDGDACTTNDRCQDFFCQGGTALECSPCETCDSVDGCVAEIQSGCDHPLSTKSSVGLKDNAVNTKDKVAWTFVDGPGSATGAFGDPTSDTDYALCVYDDSGVSPIIVASGTAPAGISWSANAKGFKYKSSSSSLTKAQLKVSGGKTKLMVKGAGAGLGMPGSLNGLGLPVVVQLKASNGQCWQTSFPTAKVSNPVTFKAKGGQ